MKLYYIVFPLGLVALGFTYYAYGYFPAALSAGFFALGWAGHKHRAYVRDKAVYEGLGYWAKVKGWFGA